MAAGGLGTRVMTFASGDFAALTAVQKNDFKGNMRVKKIVWYQPGATTDTFSILDINGTLNEQGKCEAANQSQIFAVDNWWHGISAINVTSGTIEIHLL